MRVSRRILVFTDSIRALESRCSRVATIRAWTARMRPARCTKAGMRQRRAQESQPLEGVFAGLAFDGEDVAQALSEQVAAIEARVGLGDPVELLALVVGE